MNTSDHKLLPLIPLNLKEFLAVGQFYCKRHPRKYKKQHKNDLTREALQMTAHDFIRQFNGI